MKTKVVAIPIIVALAVFIISYTTMEKSSIENSVVAETKGKAPKVAKAKVKKKQKAKTISTNKSKDRPSSEEEKEAEDDEAPIPSVAGNTAIRNVLTNKVNNYALENNMSTDYCFLVDMSLPSGRNRFFIYDLNKNSIVYSGLVAHGSCNETFLARPRFSNEAKTSCSSLGKYKVGEFYRGKYGKSFRLYGLDNCNSNAYKRAVVIHGFDCVPDEEIYPRVLCNSMGCVMVSYKFFDKIARIISKTDKPIVLWVYQ